MTIYLDNASTSWPKPWAVGDAMVAFLREGAATPGRGAYALAAESEARVARLRRRLAEMVNAEGPERVVLLGSATDALNTAILGLFTEREDDRPRVVTTRLEHNSVTRVLHHLDSRGAIEVVSVPPDRQGFVTPDAVAGASNAETALVVVSHASNVLGTIQPIAQIAAACRRAAPEALVLVDACQSIGLLPIDVQRDRIDLLAFSGHKALMGPAGVGGLYVGPRVFPGNGRRVLRPTRYGGSGSDSASRDMPEDLPSRFEAGTPNSVGQVGLLAAIEDASRPSPAEALAHERRLVDRFLAAVRDVRGVRLVGPADRSRCVGIVSLVVDAHPPEEAAAALDASFGIAVRAGLHCAPGAHEAMGTLAGGGAIRVSPGAYSTDADIDRLAAALRGLAPG